MVAEKKTDSERVGVLNCLSEKHLLTLTLPLKSRPLTANPTAKEWRYLFYRHIANVLGFCKQTDFPVLVSQVSHRIWPDIEDGIPNVTPLFVEGGKQRCSKEAIVAEEPQDPDESQASSKTPPDLSGSPPLAIARRSLGINQQRRPPIAEQGVPPIGPTITDGIGCKRRWGECVATSHGGGCEEHARKGKASTKAAPSKEEESGGVTALVAGEALTSPEFELGDGLYGARGGGEEDGGCDSRGRVRGRSQGRGCGRGRDHGRGRGCGRSKGGRGHGQLEDEESFRDSVITPEYTELPEGWKRPPILVHGDRSPWILRPRRESGSRVVRSIWEEDRPQSPPALALAGSSQWAMSPHNFTTHGGQRLLPTNEHVTDIGGGSINTHVDCKEAEHCGCKSTEKDLSERDSLDWYISCSSHSGSDSDMIGKQVRVAQDVFQYTPSRYKEFSVIGRVTRHFIHKITGELTYMVHFDGYLGHRAVLARECKVIAGGRPQP